MKFTVTALCAIALATTASALATSANLGINCRGSTNCLAVTCDANDLQDQIDKMDDGADFQPGQHIACCGDKICAFTQDTQKHISGATAKALIAAIINHGCHKCGSVPFTDNNVKEGQLTVNWIAA